MATVIIPKDKWYFVQGEHKPTIECPKCGNQLLGDCTIHGILEDGTVYNSVVCVHKVKTETGSSTLVDCGFHAHVQLEGWTGGHIKRGKMR
jgi:hypothetical protein